jgi:hypothetical protein
MEIILVDHASEDGTVEILAEFAERIPVARVHRLTRPEGGPGAARNAGIDIATGRYLSFFDADDLLTSDGLHALLRVVGREAAEIGFGDFSVFDGTGMATVRDFSPRLRPMGRDLRSRGVSPGGGEAAGACELPLCPRAGPAGRNPLSRGDCRSGCCVLGARGGEGAIDHLRAGGGLPVPLSLEPSPGGGAVVLRGGRRQVLSRSACGDGAIRRGRCRCSGPFRRPGPR